MPRNQVATEWLLAIVLVAALCVGYVHCECPVTATKIHKHLEDAALLSDCGPSWRSPNSSERQICDACVCLMNNAIGKALAAGRRPAQDAVDIMACGWQSLQALRILTHAQQFNVSFWGPNMMCNIDLPVTPAGQGLVTESGAAQDSASSSSMRFYVRPQALSARGFDVCLSPDVKKALTTPGKVEQAACPVTAQEVAASPRFKKGLNSPACVSAVNTTEPKDCSCMCELRVAMTNMLISDNATLADAACGIRCGSTEQVSLKHLFGVQLGCAGVLMEAVQTAAFHPAAIKKFNSTQCKYDDTPCEAAYVRDLQQPPANKDESKTVSAKSVASMWQPSLSMVVVVAVMAGFLLV